jgi:ketosteroid isomerase-like protein
MSRENVEVVRRMYEAFQGGDSATVNACFDPEVVVDARVRVDGAMGRGLEALGSIIGEWIAAFDGWHEDIEELRGIGDRVVAIATQRGRSKATGIDVETRYAIVYDIGGGRITRMTLYRTPEEGTEAAGLSE